MTTGRGADDGSSGGHDGLLNDGDCEALLNGSSLNSSKLVSRSADGKRSVAGVVGSSQLTHVAADSEDQKSENSGDNTESPPSGTSVFSVLAIEEIASVITSESLIVVHAGGASVVTGASSAVLRALNTTSVSEVEAIVASITSVDTASGATGSTVRAGSVVKGEAADARCAGSVEVAGSASSWASSAAQVKRGRSESSIAGQADLSVVGKVR